MATYAENQHHRKSRCAGGSRWEKTRRLGEPSAHDDDLRAVDYQLMDAAGLQRGRLTGITLRGEDLLDAGQVAQQISLDDAREARLVAEAAVDRVPRQVRTGRHRPGRRLPARFVKSSHPHPGR
ncbi:hypothetical protein [Streptomyces africanus]|uniref:hypothetical protein n=1 Tax=Streptomyces africanus TaxID=231024 RepID=UPI0031345043